MKISKKIVVFVYFIANSREIMQIANSCFLNFYKNETIFIDILKFFLV